MDYDQYKPNSHKYRHEEQKRQNLPPEKKAKKVVTGEVTTVKKSGIQKFAESLIADGIDNIQDYIVKEVIIPKAKEMVCGIADNIGDGFKNAVHKLVYGEDYRSNNQTRPYGSYYGNNNRAQTVSYRDHSFRYDDFVFRNRGDAEATLDELRENLSNYPTTSIADFYSCIDRDELATNLDNNYGWTDLRDAKIVPTRGGYILKLPKPVYLGD